MSFPECRPHRGVTACAHDDNHRRPCLRLPWLTTSRTTAVSAGTDDADSGCLVSGEALYCGGEGFTAARLNAATGKTAWRFSGEVDFVNGYGRLLALGSAAGDLRWQTPAREGARERAEAGPPRIYLKSDAIVAHTGGLAFSVSPLAPEAPAPD